MKEREVREEGRKEGRKEREGRKGGRNEGKGGRKEVRRAAGYEHQNARCALFLLLLEGFLIYFLLACVQPADL